MTRLLRRLARFGIRAEILQLTFAAGVLVGMIAEGVIVGMVLAGVGPL